jgi:hypothetical protein
VSGAFSTRALSIEERLARAGGVVAMDTPARAGRGAGAGLPVAQVIEVGTHSIFIGGVEQVVLGQGLGAWPITKILSPSGTGCGMNKVTGVFAAAIPRRTRDGGGTAHREMARYVGGGHRLCRADRRDGRGARRHPHTATLHALMVLPGFKDTSMVTVTIIDREGREIQAAAPTGLTLMEANRRAGLDESEAMCGGSAPAQPVMSILKAMPFPDGRG